MEKNRKQRKYGRLWAALYRKAAVALGIVLLAGQMEISAYATENSEISEGTADDIFIEEADKDSGTGGSPAADQEGTGETPGDSQEQQPGTENTGESANGAGTGEDGSDSDSNDDDSDSEIKSDEQPEGEIPAEENAEGTGQGLPEEEADILLPLSDTVADGMNQMPAAVGAEEETAGQQVTNTTLMAAGAVLRPGESFTIDQVTYEYLSTRVDQDMNPLAYCVKAKAADKNISGRLEIPERVEYDGYEYEVVQIPKAGFRECAGLTEVELPETVLEIEESAFDRCTDLKSINIPARVKKIGTYTFYECENLERIEVPGRVTVIMNAAFWGCSHLKEVRLSEGLTEIDGQAFQRCYDLENINIPNSVKSLGYGSTFSECSALKSIFIPVGIQSIERGTFSHCTNLSQMEIAVTVTEADGVRKVTPVSLSDPRNVFNGYNGTAERTLNFLNADGSARLTGEELNAAIAAYRNVDDGNRSDDLWYGWKLPAMEGGGTTGGENRPGTGDTSGDGLPGNSDADSTDGGSDDGGNGGGTAGGSDDGGNGGGTAGGSDVSGNGGVDYADGAVSPVAEITVSIAGKSAEPEISGQEAAGTKTEDTAKKGQAKEPKTGDASYIEVYATLAMIAGLTWLVLCFMEEGRGMSAREKEVFVAAFIRWAKKGGIFRKCCAFAAIFCILAYYHGIGRRVFAAAENRMITRRGKEA